MRTAALATFVALAAAADCGEEVVPPLRTGQVVTGDVILNATHTDEVGTALDERVVTDATGLRVELRRDDGMTLRTTSSGGSFRFEAVPNGTWRARTWADPAAPVESPPFDVADAPAAVADPLILPSSTQLVAYPNPFVRASGLGLELPMSSGGTIDFEILTLGLDRVWSGSLANVPPGYFHVHWGGADVTGPAGLYWGHVQDAAGDYYDLVFKND